VSDEEGSMFKKKHDDELVAPVSSKKKDEHAYEDAWYRALKAQSDRPLEHDESDEAVDAAED
jgi:hypothetical protein